MKTNNKKRKVFVIIVIVILLLLSLVGTLMFVYSSKQKKNKITINEKYLSKTTDNMYNLTEKIDSLNGEIITKEKIVDVSINVKSGNLNILDKKLENSKQWKFDEVSFVPGTNEVCINAKLEKSNLEQCFTINNYNEENIGNIDAGDTDNDGLKNYEEIILGTDSTKKDTDDDSLNDYQEIYITLTNPLAKDSDEDGIEDASEDFDEDKIINSEELKRKTSVHMSDTDEDGLNDYDELNEYNTVPIQKDTDGDGIDDYIEIYETNTDPNKKQQKIDVSKTSDDGIASVEIKNLNGRAYESLTITKADVSLLNSGIAGYILDAYEFSVEQDKIDAVISFDLSSIDLNDGTNPTIYYYNEETQMLEELATVVENGKAYAGVNHFSKYILIDKNSHDAIWSEDLSYLIGDNYNNLDVVFVIDISASMDENDPTDSRKQMMSNFISSLRNEDRAGVVIFRRTSQILNNGFSNSEGDKKKLITDVFNISNDNGREWDSGTNGSNGLYTAIKMFGDREEAKRYIIFLTDGLDTHQSYKYEEIYQLAKEKHITILTIGLGVEADGELLNTIAESTGGKYYHSEDSEGLYETHVDILKETEDYRIDSNNDGISDYFTKLICDGTITTAAGLNPFEGLSYKEIQKNDDQDQDGLKNGEEVKVVVLDDKVYLKYISDPVFVDSDGDTLEDMYDASPNHAFNSKFAIGNILNDKLDVSSLESDVAQFNSLFNKGKRVTKNLKSYIEYEQDGILKYSPAGLINVGGELTNAAVTAGAFMGGAIGAGDAHNAWKRYLSQTAIPYTEEDLVVKSTKKDKINDNSIYGSPDVQENLKNNYEMVMNAAEESVKDGNTIVIKSVKNLKGSGSDSNLNVFGFLHNSSSKIIAEVTNNNGKYNMKMRYFIVDVYDWKNAEECDIELPACVSEVHYFNQMLLGKAKAFLVKIEYDINITWEKGKEPTVTLLEGTPYA